MRLFQVDDRCWWIGPAGTIPVIVRDCDQTLNTAFVFSPRSGWQGWVPCANLKLREDV